MDSNGCFRPETVIHWDHAQGPLADQKAVIGPTCIILHLRPSGGIRPAERARSRLALTLAEREEISRGIALGQSLRSIAGCLCRSPSTVSREIKRNGGPARYRAAGADKRAWADRTEPAGEIRILQISWLPVSSQCAPSCGPRALRVRRPKLLNPTTRPRQSFGARRNQMSPGVPLALF